MTIIPRVPQLIYVPIANNGNLADDVYFIGLLPSPDSFLPSPTRVA